MEITPQLLTYSLQVSLKSAPETTLAWKNNQLINAIVAKVNPELQTILLQLPEGQQVEARSELPLRPGTQLQLNAEFQQGQWILRVRNSASPEETVMAALRRALPRATPLAPVFEKFTQLLQNPKSVPEPIRAQLQTLVETFSTPAQLGKADTLQAALRNSGLLLESQLADPQSPPPANDLKARLLTLLATLSTNPARETQSPAPTTAQNSPVATGSETPKSGDAPTVQKPSAHHSDAPAPLLQEDSVDLGGLVKQVEGALSRVQLHQLRAAPDGQQQPQWTFELPVRTQLGTETLLLRFEREAEREAQSNGNTSAGWRVTLELSHPEFGPLRAVVLWQGGAISTRFFAERPDTAALFRQYLPVLSAQLTTAGISVGTMEAHNGLPANGARPIEKGLLSERA